MSCTPCRARFLGLIGWVAVLVAGNASAWDDVSEGQDLPWLGGGGRAHYYRDKSSCFGCPTGYRTEERWGRSRFSGEDPYATVSKAMTFLDQSGFLATGAPKHGAGTVYVETGLVTPRALPYHFTVVMIEPTVVVMNFDLGELVRGDQVPKGQIIGNARIDGFVSYGTQVPATGSLLWFSPDSQAPTPVAGQTTGRGEIRIKAATLTLERRGDEWTVTRK